MKSWGKLLLITTFLFSFALSTGVGNEAVPTLESAKVKLKSLNPGHT